MPKATCSRSTDGDAPLAGDLEKLLEMVALAVIDDVEDLVGVPGFDAILDGRQVGRGVGERAVALANQEGRLGLLDEDDDRPFALDGDASCLQVGDDRGELGVVEALAELDVEFHAQAVVHGLERSPGNAA